MTYIGVAYSASHIYIYMDVCIMNVYEIEIKNRILIFSGNYIKNITKCNVNVQYNPQVLIE